MSLFFLKSFLVLKIIGRYYKEGEKVSAFIGTSVS